MFKLLTEDETKRYYSQPTYTLLDVCYLLAGYSPNPGYGDMFRSSPANADSPREINQAYVSILCALQGTRDSDSLLHREHGETFKAWTERKHENELEAGLSTLNFFAGTKVSREILTDFALRWNQRPAFLFGDNGKAPEPDAVGRKRRSSPAPGTRKRRSEIESQEIQDAIERLVRENPKEETFNKTIDRYRGGVFANGTKFPVHKRSDLRLERIVRKINPRGREGRPKGIK